MLKEYVVDLLEKRFSSPMFLAQELIEEHSLAAFLESASLQEILYQSWLPHLEDLSFPSTLFPDRERTNPYSHRWYLRKFLLSLQRSIKIKQLSQMARIHSMMIDISVKQHAQLRLCLSNFDAYIQWQQAFCQEQYQIAFKVLC